MNNIITEAIKNNKLAHAYLFYGDKGVDLDQYIFNAIKSVIESKGFKIKANNFNELNYYDLKIIHPNKDGNILKDMVDTTLTTLFETSLEKNAIKILYIKDVDRGNKVSLNRLLKFVEEPVDNLIIFMSSNYVNKVISTIRSRTQNIFIKRENPKEKIAIMKNVSQKFAVLFANIYSNIEKAQAIDLNLFEKTYNNIRECLEKTLINKYNFKNSLFEIWTKNNNEYVLNIIRFFFLQVMVKIDKKNPLFPEWDLLIEEYKRAKIDYFTIELNIENFRRNIDHFANFNLQKINFLNQVEKILLEEKN